MKLTYVVAFQLMGLIGRLKVDSYDEIEVIRNRKEVLSEVLKGFFGLHNGDQAKILELQNNECALSKDQVAYLSKNEFKEAIFRRGFNGDEVEFLEYWLVKE